MALVAEMSKFHSAVQETEPMAVCPCIYQIVHNDPGQSLFRISVDPVNSLQRATFRLFGGCLVGILMFDALQLPAKEVVFWLRDLDTLAVQAWERADYEIQMGSAQGDLISLIPCNLRVT